MSNASLFARALLVGTSCVLSIPGLAAGAAWGSFLKPFAVDSPWNARPKAPVFAEHEIPKSDYFPAVSAGAFSTGVFLSAASDAAVSVHPPAGRPGLWDPDAEAFQPQLTVPRWPASVVAAPGDDGHADIVDPVTGIVHSFWQLKQADGVWRATQHAWTRIHGSGWGDPGHYMQGARASGVPTMAGLIRKHEVDDGDTLYRHALAMSLTFNALSPKPAYIAPATAADIDAAKTNTGRIPEGALLMLPPSYDTAAIRNPQLRKIADTLKVYGGYVVDRNWGTPFIVYVEMGSKLDLHQGGWNNEVAVELDKMRSQLRQVVSTSGWLDGDGRPMAKRQRMNLLSMRGPWQGEGGSAPAGRFDSLRQAVLFDAGSETLSQTNSSDRSLGSVEWAKPVAGAKYRLNVRASGGARLRLRLQSAQRAVLLDSGLLGDGQSLVFEWPAHQAVVSLTVRSGGSGAASSVGGTLVPESAAEKPGPG